MSLPIAHIEDAGRSGFFIEQDGQTLARMTYRRLSPELISVDHTLVDAHLRGQGLARQLLDALAAWARESGTKVTASCSYVVVQLQQDASLQDIKC